jgi:hypothetical protein
VRTPPRGWLLSQHFDVRVRSLELPVIVCSSRSWELHAVNSASTPTVRRHIRRTFRLNLHHCSDRKAHSIAAQLLAGVPSCSFPRRIAIIDLRSKRELASAGESGHFCPLLLYHWHIHKDLPILPSREGLVLALLGSEIFITRRVAPVMDTSLADLGQPDQTFCRTRFGRLPAPRVRRDGSSSGVFCCSGKSTSIQAVSVRAPTVRKLDARHSSAGRLPRAKRCLPSYARQFSSANAVL